MISYFLNSVLKYRLCVCVQNISRAFPDISYNEIKSHTTAFYKNLSRIIIEMIFPSRTTLVVDARSLAQLDSITNAERTTILLMGHYGNWEVLHKLALFTSMPVKALYKPVKNQYLNRWIYNRRTKYGLQLLKSGEALRMLLKDDNDNAIIIFIADQFPGKDNGIALEFLNQKTRMFAGAEQLARKLNAVVCYAELSPDTNHIWHLKITTICEQAAATGATYITTSFASMLEASIYKNPSLWLWSHKRWK